MLTVAERTRQTDDFSERLAEHVRDFYWITNDIFSDLRLDALLATANDVVAFLKFLDDCARFLCENGPVMRCDFVNALVGDTDHWDVNVPVEYPLLGLGRIANLVTGALPAVSVGDTIAWHYGEVWSPGELSRRMRQERIIEHRGD